MNRSKKYIFTILNNVKVEACTALLIDESQDWAMSDMTTQEMIVALDGELHLTRHDRHAIASRLTALEKALRPFGAIEPSSIYHDDDVTEAYDPGYVVLLCEDHQRPDITRDDLNRARAILDTVHRPWVVTNTTWRATSTGPIPSVTRFYTGLWYTRTYFWKYSREHFRIARKAKVLLKSYTLYRSSPTIEYMFMSILPGSISRYIIKSIVLYLDKIKNKDIIKTILWSGG